MSCVDHRSIFFNLYVYVSVLSVQKCAQYFLDTALSSSEAVLMHGSPI